MDATRLFATLVAQRHGVHAQSYSNLPAYHHLAKAGLIEETGVVSSIICNECDQPHDAKVVFEQPHYGYYCPDLGFIPTPRANLIMARPNLHVFITQIADALKCKRRKSTPVSGSIWRIGAVETHVGDIAVYFQPTLQDAQDLYDLKTVLAGEVKSKFGIVITATGVLSLPSFVTVQLTDILSFDHMACHFVIDSSINVIAGVPEKRKGGRPGDYKTTLPDLIAQRQNQGVALKGKNEEAKAVRADHKVKYPNENCPSISTIKRCLSNT